MLALMASSDTGPFLLPPGLPVGQYIPSCSPLFWISDAPVKEPVTWWSRCQKQVDSTNLRPVLCPWPSHPRQPKVPPAISEVQLEAELEASWRSYRAMQLRRQTRVPDAYVPDDVEPFEDDPGPPYDQWPGLAPETRGPSALTPEEAARLALEELMADPYGHGQGSHLALVPAGRSADIPVAMGWDADAPLEQLCWMLRSWEDRFGACVVVFQGSSIFVSVARPPRTLEHATHIALEHVLTGADNINDGTTPFPRYAASLIDAHLWHFWWD